MLNEVVSICKLVLVNPATSPGGGGGGGGGAGVFWGGGGGGGVLLGVLGGGVPPGSPNPDPISGQKIVIFHTCFQSWPLGRNYVIIFFRIFLLRSYSFGIETINTFIHSRSFLEIHTRLRTKNGQSVQYVKTLTQSSLMKSEK